MRCLLLLCALASAGCLRTTEYQCSGNNTCGTAGMCETTGFCSFPDGECTSGRRYNEAAGTLAGQCTNGGTTFEDANNMGSDGPMGDGPTGDVPVAQCPNGYSVLTGGNAGHMYMVITIDATWPQQEAACQLTTLKSHLAVPDNITELTALDNLVGTGRFWIGLTDSMPPSTAEGTFYTVLGVVATYLPWETGAPTTGGGPEEDCVEADPAQHKINDQRCTNTTQPAVCECTP